MCRISRWATLTSSLLGVFFALFLVVSPAFAVHDNDLFELDGNTYNSAILLGDDWSLVFGGTSNGVATSFINDSFANGEILGFESRTPEVSFFTGGGSKDVNCIQNPCVEGGKKGGGWQYDTVNDVVPDKNDIVTAFAAAYKQEDNGEHTFFYFGLDTYAVQGDANAGFWFFRRPVTLTPLEPGEVSGTFNGGHSHGDIFVAVAYTGGGKIGEIKVYEWDATISGNKPVGLVEVASGLDCSQAAADDDVCGRVNSTAGEDPDWNYLNKDGLTTYQVPAFVEFGMDVNAILGVDEIGCFSSFMAETRSSQSETAQLKDFALGAFPVCEIEVTKSGEPLSKVGDTIDYSITIENTGLATLHKDSITDTLVGDLTDGNNTAITSNTCGASLAPDATCTIDYTYTVLGTDPDPLLNTVTITYTEFSGGLGLPFSDSYTETVNLFQPAITFDKKADGSDGPLSSPLLIDQGATVNYSLLVTNNSSSDTPNLICDITDLNLGVDVNALSIGSGSNHTVYNSVTFDFPSASPFSWCAVQSDGSFLCNNTASVSCSPDGFPNILSAGDTVYVSVTPAQVLLTVVKDGDVFGKVGDPVDYTITINNTNLNESVTLDSITDTLLGDLMSANIYVTSNTCDDTTPPYEMAPNTSCVITASRTVLGTDPNPLPNEVSVTGFDSYGNTAPAAIDSHSVDLLAPDLTVEKSCLESGPVPPGSFVSFQIDIANLGDAELVLTSVYDNVQGKELLAGAPDPVDLNVQTTPPCEDADYLIGPTTGCYRLEDSVQAATSNVFNDVTVTASLNARYGLPNQLQESDSAFCEVETGVTRTLGFWKTHGSDGQNEDPKFDVLPYGYTCYVATQIFPIDLGWKKLEVLDSCEDVFGVFWEDMDQCKNLDKVKLQGSQQFLAAMLNDEAFGTAIPEDCKNGYAGWTNSELFAEMSDALSNNSPTYRHIIKELAAVFACYNESGDELAIVDTVAVPPADPNGTRGIATDICF